ncbi:MAG: NADH-quinone oxidoreductase subunit C [Acidobacteriota bacterium]
MSGKPESLTQWPAWDGNSTVARLRAAFPTAVLEDIEFRGERTVIVQLAQISEVLAFLRDEPECDFAMLTDVTAIHWPARVEPFDVLWHLYSFSRNLRLRVKCRVKDRVPSAVPLWSGAGWMERECFDMFGILFDGHPDLRRILMPDDFDGHPLRKEFPLKR